MKGLKRVCASGLALAALAVAGPAAAQPAAGGQAPAAPTNLKVLQPADVRGAMGAFTQALGVQCGY